MKRVLTVAALLATLTACGGTEPRSDPIPTIETSDTTTADPTPAPTTSTTTSTATTTPPPAAPATEVPDVAPAPVEPTPYTPPPAEPPPAVYYANCSEARAAGAAPLHRGDPGYRSGLDRDDDGVACET
jgi:hypothetical protein